jgi:hypothetical protein
VRLSNAGLPKEHRTSATRFYKYREDCENRRQDNEAHRGAHEVQRPFSTWHVKRQVHTIQSIGR